jgi:asparagine synthase (glutamine-hydrolysing)
MCGIAGLFSTGADRTAEALERTVRDMSSALEHRGPDAGGTWVDAVAGIGLGHRRLSIIDLSPNGAQPMISESGRWVIAFNGEIYNFRELSEELASKGHRFRGHSDTEVLLAAVEEWGLIESLKRSVGMFALALWDRSEKALHLARDRVGEKPLYYGWAGRSFVFASELKAIRRFREWQPAIDRQALALFMRYSYIPAPYSIYEGISKLQPGSILTISPIQSRKLSIAAYWSLSDVVKAGAGNGFRGGEEDAVQHLDDLLRISIRGQMVSDVPLGAFLSGGVDSSAVVALMQAESSRPVKTFTIGFGEHAYNEAVYAKAVAEHLGTDHTELYVTSEDALAVIPRLPTLYDEPFADSSQIPTFLVSRLARQNVTVTLSGDGGDELFGGYNRYFLARAIWQRVSRIPRPIRRAAAYGITRVSPKTWTAMFSRLSPSLTAPLRPRTFGEGLFKVANMLRVSKPDEIYRMLLSHWEDPAAVVRDLSEPEVVRPQLTDYTEQMMYLDTMTYLPDDILVKVDRASMSVSLESRVPLLDYRIIEFAWTLPLSLKIRDGEGQGKWLLRQVLYRYVPKRLLERPKMGFGVPIDDWLCGPLREWAEALLERRRLEGEGFFHADPIRQKWKEHLSGAGKWQYLLWDVLMFQAWWEQARQSNPVAHASPDVSALVR